MSVYQQGMLPLHRIRQKGQQRIMVQYVNVSQGNHAVVEHIEPDAGREGILSQQCPPAS